MGFCKKVSSIMPLFMDGETKARRGEMGLKVTQQGSSRTGTRSHLSQVHFQCMIHNAMLASLDEGNSEIHGNNDIGGLWSVIQFVLPPLPCL